MIRTNFGRRSAGGVTALALSWLLVLPTLAVSPATGSKQSADLAAARRGENAARAVVLFQGASVAAATGVTSGPAADAHRARLARQHAEYRAWLSRNVPQARVLHDYDTVVNGVSVELRGADARAVSGGPGVRRVVHPTWMSPSMDTSLDLVDWDVATGRSPDQAGVDVGEGVLVGIVDSGIDASHPFFRVDSSNESFYKNADGSCKLTNTDANNQTQYTSCKVIVAKVFNAEVTSAQAVDSHGTHVAGTVAGTSATSSPTGSLSGVAPAAFLGNYNVFPGETGSASSDDIAVAVQEAVEDGMDVLNLSLGGDPGRTGYDVLELALRDAGAAGVLAAVAAGNSGPGAGTVESPGRAPWVLTAGASTNPHFLGQSAQASGHDATGAATGDFQAFPDPAVSNAYVWWDTIDGRGTGEACESRPLSGANLAGKIALIKRGTCVFTTKVRNAEAVGASGAIVFNNVAGDPIAMAHDGTDPFPTIPAVMVSKSYGTAMAASSGSSVTVGGAVTDRAGTADVIAGFSSRGPAGTPDGLLIKPDMAAPGVNIYSSVVCESTACGYGMYQGTSMATPHLAGAAAAVMWQRGWSEAFPRRDEQVKSLLVNTALDGVVKDHVEGTETVGILDEGAGRLDVDGAFDGSFYADPVSLSFGQVRTTSASRSTTLSGSGTGYSVTAVSGPGLSGVTVSASVSGDVVTVRISRKSGVRGDGQGIVTVSNGSATIAIPYWIRF